MPPPDKCEDNENKGPSISVNDMMKAIFQRHHHLPTSCRRIISAALASVCVLLCGEAAAQSSFASYDFLKITSSAHAFALGGNGAAIIDDDISLVNANPALLGPEIDMQAGVAYMHYLGSSNFASANFGMAASERSAWAAGIRYLNYGSFKGYEADGTSSGTFSAADIVIDGSYSHDITDRLRGGITMKMIYSHYESYSAFAMALDLGVNYYNEENDLSLSLLLANMGGQIKRFETAYNRLPFDIRIAYMQTIASSPIQISVGAENLTRWKLPYYSHKTDDGDVAREIKSGFFSNLFRHLTFGVQYSPSEKFYVALGYNYKTRTDMSAYRRNFLSGFSIGTGIKVKSFGIGVAYAMPHRSASSLMVNLNLAIGDYL